MNALRGCRASATFAAGLMALSHDFFLLPASEAHERWGEYAGATSPVKLRDDVLVYLSDSFRWIRTWNPARREAFEGLCYTGPTLIEGDAAQQFGSIIRAWAALFRLGPEALDLTGATWTRDDGEMGVDRIRIDRDELLATLARLVEWSDVAVARERVILTTGI
jgi:hypothetical protein